MCYAMDADAAVAIWGAESNYGSHTSNKSVTHPLVTLAYEGRHPEFAHAQLLVALRVPWHGDVPASFIIDPWTDTTDRAQFILTTCNQYTMNSNGDGRRNTWDSPGDALASAASYLKVSG